VDGHALKSIHVFLGFVGMEPNKRLRWVLWASAITLGLNVLAVVTAVTWATMQPQRMDPGCTEQSALVVDEHVY